MPWGLPVLTVTVHPTVTSTLRSLPSHGLLDPTATSTLRSLPSPRSLQPYGHFHPTVISTLRSFLPYGHFHRTDYFPSYGHFYHFHRTDYLTLRQLLPCGHFRSALRLLLPQGPFQPYSPFYPSLQPCDLFYPTASFTLFYLSSLLYLTPSFTLRPSLPYIVFYSPPLPYSLLYSRLGLQCS